MIPVYRPQITEDDIQAVSFALRMREVSGHGSPVTTFENRLAEYIGVEYAIAVSSRAKKSSSRLSLSSRVRWLPYVLVLSLFLLTWMLTLGVWMWNR